MSYEGCEIKIVLTFDDGPHHVAPSSNYTNEILDILEGRNIKAVFFIQTHALSRPYSGSGPKPYFRGMHDGGKDMVHRMRDDCHVVGFHTAAEVHGTHNRENWHTEISAAELRARLDTGKDFIDLNANIPRWVRPPGGHHNSSVRAIYSEKDLDLVMWDLDTEDWKSDAPAGVLDRIDDRLTQKINAGETELVVLFHDIQENTADNLEDYLDKFDEVANREGCSIKWVLTLDEITDILDGQYGG